jgi:hypothetical protein
MAIEWRIKIYDEAFANENIIGMGDAVESLPDFSVAGDGDCLEGNFEAVIATFGIKPRSIIILETNTDGAGWVARHRGVCTMPGAKRSPNPSNVKSVGHKHVRFEEKIIPALRIAGGDVAAMVRSVLSVTGNRPAGTTYDATEIPDLSLSLGDRYGLGLETLKDFMDALAAACPADGATPKVTYGMKADGELFFRRVNTSATYQDGVAGVRVAWKDLDAEEVVTKVIVLLADKPQPDAAVGLNLDYDQTLVIPKEYIPVPLVATFDAGNAMDAAKVVAIPLNEGLLVNQTEVFNSASSFGVTNGGNAVDNDPATFADMGPLLATLMLNDITGYVVAARVSYESNAEDDELRLVIGYAPTSITTIVCWIRLPLPRTNGTPATAIVYGLVSTGLLPYFTLSGVQVDLRGKDPAKTYAVKIYSLEAFKLDTAAAERIAKSFVKLPAQDAAAVIVPGLASPVTRLTLTGIGTYDVERVSYGIDKEYEAGGVVTTFHLGQAYDAEETARVAVDKRREHQSTAKAIAFRRKV